MKVVNRRVDHGKGRDPDANKRVFSNPGGNTGDNVGSIQEDTFKLHRHTLSNSIIQHYRSFKGEDGEGSALKDEKVTQNDMEWINETKETGESETRPRNVYINFIIKAF